METFIKVVFWMTVVTAALRMLVIALTDEWPRPYKKSLGLEVVELILGIGLATWAGLLLWAF